MPKMYFCSRCQAKYHSDDVVIFTICNNIERPLCPKCDNFLEEIVEFVHVPVVNLGAK